jgi:hypothetical protein
VRHQSLAGALDGGGAGERVFQCCSDTLASCGGGSICPGTWSQAQAQAPSLCDPNSGGSSPELGSCGDDHVFRFRLSGSTQFTLYYDASGALIAEANEGLDRCTNGPAGGLTLPVCDATLASACPDGGAAP